MPRRSVRRPTCRSAASSRRATVTARVAGRCSTSTPRPRCATWITPACSSAHNSTPTTSDMASTASFDISTGADLQEVDNAVNQSIKEITGRYDFKGTHCTVEFDRAKATIALLADDERRMEALLDVVQLRLIKRGVPVKKLKAGD